MSNVPDPDQTPDGPAYQGRLLARPDDEVVDQGAGFDVATVFTRRRILGLFGIGAGAVALAACGGASSSTVTDSASSSASTTSAGEIPEETNGPYPADGSNGVTVLEDSGIVRSDITTSIGSDVVVDGVPLSFTFNVVDMAGGNVPFEGAALYAWQCNAQGEYSMYTSGVEDETFLRGIQVADAEGNLTFQTIVPGCYSGRWPHIHFEVYPDVASATDVANVIATSQVAIPAEYLTDVYALDSYSGSAENLAAVGSLADDNVFVEGDVSLQTPQMSGDATSGFVGSLTVNVDTSTENTGGGMGGGMGGTPPSGGPGGGGPGGGEPPSGNPPSGAPGSGS